MRYSKVKNFLEICLLFSKILFFHLNLFLYRGCAGQYKERWALCQLPEAIRRVLENSPTSSARRSRITRGVSKGHPSEGRYRAEAFAILCPETGVSFAHNGDNRSDRFLTDYLGDAPCYVGLYVHAGFYNYSGTVRRQNADSFKSSIAFQLSRFFDRYQTYIRQISVCRNHIRNVVAVGYVSQNLKLSSSYNVVVHHDISETVSSAYGE